MAFSWILCDQGHTTIISINLAFLTQGILLGCPKLFLCSSWASIFQYLLVSMAFIVEVLGRSVESSVALLLNFKVILVLHVQRGIQQAFEKYLSI